MLIKCRNSYSFKAGLVGQALVLCAIMAGMAGCDDRAGELADLRSERNELRAYEGAPPVVPHDLDEIGRENCLSCHKKGNATKYGRTASITPHPEFINCRQCHVPRVEDDKFAKNEFEPYRITTSLPNIQPLGPPYIPHGLQNRGDCRSCHLSETTPSVLLPAHGERTNCVQCHVPRVPVAGFPAPAAP